MKKTDFTKAKYYFNLHGNVNEHLLTPVFVPHGDFVAHLHDVDVIVFAVKAARYVVHY